MQVGFMMQKALSELFILKSTKPLPIIFKGTLWQQWKQHDRCNCHVSRSTLQKCISQSANNLLRVKKAVTQTSPETAQQYIKRAVHCMTWSHLQYYHSYSAVDDPSTAHWQSGSQSHSLHTSELWIQTHTKRLQYMTAAELCTTEPINMPLHFQQKWNVIFSKNTAYLEKSKTISTE